MEKLPPEILAEIINNLPGKEHPGYWLNKHKKDLARYSSISRAWNASIERLTFRSLTVETDELDNFAALYSGDKISRRTHLRYLNINIVLPIPPNEMGCCPFSQPPDRQADSVSFSNSVAKVFTILADLAVRSWEQQPLTLRFLGATRLSKHKGKVNKYESCKGLDGERGKHFSEEIREAKAVSGQFELLHEDAIPTVHGVTDFEFRGFDLLEYLKLNWISGLVTRLPDLQRFKLAWDDSYENGRLRRMANRKYLGKSICSLVGNNLLDDGEWAREPMYCMFNHLASLPNLAVLKLKGSMVICPEFFYGIAEYCGTPFPALTDFELRFDPETADGRWFFDLAEPDPVSDSDIEDYETHSIGSDGSVSVYGDVPIKLGYVPSNHNYRIDPNPTALWPFLMGALKAFKRIPKLQKFILGLRDYQHPYESNPDFELCYVKAGRHRTQLGCMPNPHILADVTYLNQDRLYWRVSFGIHSEEIQKAWNDNVGPDAKIIFLEAEKWKQHESNANVYIYEGEL